MIETCEHEPCGFNNRLLYCEAEENNSVAAAKVIEVVDELLFAGSGATSELYRHCSDSTGETTERSFVVTGVEGELLAESSISVCYSRQRGVRGERYEVGLTQRHTNLANDWPSWRSVSYSIDLYSNGNVAFGLIEQHNPQVSVDGVLQGTRIPVAMTNYDYGILLDELMRVREQHDIEAQDRANSLRARSGD